MEQYIIPILIFAAIGLLAGILLNSAAKIFEVKVDSRIEEINSILPQANCGACGYAGCADYAGAIIEKNAANNLCKPGGENVIANISGILGTDAGEFIRETAVLHCGGDCDSTGKKYSYEGIQTCAAAKRFYGGNVDCKYGCMGFGDCASVCEYGAIEITDGIARINKALCSACEKCVKVCPNNLISVRPVTKHIDVACSSKDNGKITKQNCKKGCIGCKICEKKCLKGAIAVTDFVAKIDYSKCISCDSCYNACPTGAITNCEIQSA